MNEIFETLTTPQWWISVVIVGIAINIFSAYLKPLLDNRFSTMFSWWKVRTEKQRKERSELINKVRNSQQEQILISIDDIRNRSRANFALLLGIFILVLNGYSFFPQVYSIIFFGLSAFLFFFSYLMFIKAASLKSILNIAMKDEEE